MSQCQSPSVEIQLLADVRRRTGRAFGTLNEIGVLVSHGKVSNDDLRVLLPILATWVDHIAEPNWRGFVYQIVSMAGSPRGLFEDVVRWWKTETDQLSRNHLTIILACMLRDSDGERIWQLCKNEPPGTTRAPIWARLAKSPTVRGEVLDAIVSALRSGRFDYWELHEYVKLADPRIVVWFKQHENSENRALRELAKKAARKIPPPPEWLRPVDARPDRTAEVHSREADLSKLDSVLRSIGKKLGVAAPKLGKAKAFLSNAGESQWFMGNFGQVEDRSYLLWLRAEDTDIAEIVITQGQPAVNEERVM